MIDTSAWCQLDRRDEDTCQQTSRRVELNSIYKNHTQSVCVCVCVLLYEVIACLFCRRQTRWPPSCSTFHDRPSSTGCYGIGITYATYIHCGCKTDDVHSISMTTGRRIEDKHKQNKLKRLVFSQRHPTKKRRTWFRGIQTSQLDLSSTGMGTTRCKGTTQRQLPLSRWGIFERSEIRSAILRPRTPPLSHL